MTVYGNFLTQIHRNNLLRRWNASQKKKKYNAINQNLYLGNLIEPLFEDQGRMISLLHTNTKVHVVLQLTIYIQRQMARNRFLGNLKKIKNIVCSIWSVIDCYTFWSMVNKPRVYFFMNPWKRILLHISRQISTFLFLFFRN